MREFIILYAFGAEEENLIILPSWWKLLWFILSKSWRCTYLSIHAVVPAEYVPVEEEWPCDSCLRWEECNGVDRDNCPRF